VLFRDSHAFGAEVIHHTVVHLDDRVHFRLTDRQEPRGELLVANESQALRGESDLLVHLPREPESDRQREHEDRFDRDQPEMAVEEQVGAEPREEQVQHHEVGDGAPAQAHTAISYFSKRR
jgi:hypothetical protein